MAELAAQIADALDHAHEQGVIHRDIKPSNLILDQQGKPYVADFGLARIGSDTAMTVTGDLVGTLRYMSPEQALARRVGVDHRTDIYSLGVTLYELLALRPAFPSEVREELLRQIALEEPAPLRRANKAIPADLETIVLKAIAKEPSDRYPTAADLRRYVADQPVKAKRPGLMKRTVAWSTRHLMIVATTGAFLIVGLIASTVAAGILAAANKRTNDALGQVSGKQQLAEANFKQAEAERNGAETAREAAARERDAAVRRAYALTMRQAVAAGEDGFGRLRQTLLDRQRPTTGSDDLRGWEWHFLNSSPLRGPVRVLTEYSPLRSHEPPSPDGSKFVLKSFTSTSAYPFAYDVFDSSTGDFLFRIPDQYGGNTHWCADSSFLAVDRRHRAEDTTNNGPDELCLYSAHDGQLLRSVVSPELPYSRVAWCPTGRRIATMNYAGQLDVWDAATLTCEMTVACATDNVMLYFSPDGTRLAAVRCSKGIKRPVHGSDRWEEVPDPDGSFSTLTIYDVPSGTVAMSYGEEAGHNPGAHAWHPSGNMMLIELGRGRTTLVNVLDGRVLREWAGQCWVRWSPDGQFLAVCEEPEGNGIEVFDPTGSTRIERVAQGTPVSGATWTRNSQQLLAYIPTGSATPDAGRSEVWNVPTGTREHSSAETYCEGDSESTWWGPSGNELIHIGRGMWGKRSLDTTPGESRVTLDADIRDIAWSNSGRQFALADWRAEQGSVRILDADELKEVCRLNVSASEVEWRSNDSQLYVRSSETMHELWDIAKAERLELDDLRMHHVSNVVEQAGSQENFMRWQQPQTRFPVDVTPDGNSTAVGIDADVLVEVTKGARFALRVGDSVSDIAWSPRADMLAVGTTDCNIVIWNVRRRTLVAMLQGHTGDVTALAWNSDSTRLASASYDGTVRLWDWTAQSEVLTLRSPQGRPYHCIAWSPDGMRLLATGRGGEVCMWEARPSYEAEETDEEVRAAFRQWRVRSPDELEELVARAVTNAHAGTVARYWSTLGIAHYRAGDHAAATASFLRAERFGELSTPDRFVYAMAAADQNQFRQADMAWTLDPSDPWTAALRAEAAGRLGVAEDKRLLSPGETP